VRKFNELCSIVNCEICCLSVLSATKYTTQSLFCQQWNIFFVSIEIYLFNFIASLQACQNKAHMSRVMTKPWVCDQHGSKSACASTQSDQDPCCSITNLITSRETDSEQHGSWSDCADAGRKRTMLSWRGSYKIYIVCSDFTKVFIFYCTEMYISTVVVMMKMIVYQAAEIMIR
jgi:hypothetical protein